MKPHGREQLKLSCISLNTTISQLFCLGSFEPMIRMQNVDMQIRPRFDWED